MGNTHIRMYTHEIQTYRCADMHTMYSISIHRHAYAMYIHIYICTTDIGLQMFTFSWQSIYDRPRWQGRGVIHIRPQPSTEVVKEYFRIWVCQKTASNVRKLPAIIVFWPRRSTNS